MIVKISIAIVALSTLTACNTMEGLGKDVRNLGTNLENAAAQNKQRKPNPTYTPNPSDKSYQQSYPAEPVQGKELETIPYDKY